VAITTAVSKIARKRTKVAADLRVEAKPMWRCGKVLY